MTTVFHRGLAAAVVLVLLAGSLAACARPVGDFGRAAPSYTHDTKMPEMGRNRAAADGEPVSSFNLTDQEREMHDRIWRFLIAPHARDWFYNTAVELQRTRLTGVRDTRFDPDRYYNHLRATEFESSRVRYRAVNNDIGMDLATIPDTFVAICKVIEVDRQRTVAVGNVALGAPDGPQQVDARIWENNQTIAWFVRALDFRFTAYSMALDRLLVETPHEEARMVDVRLGELEVFVDRAKAHDFCGAAVTKDPPLPSRFETHPRPHEPVYRK